MAVRPAGASGRRSGVLKNDLNALRFALRIISAGFLVSTLSVTASGSLEALGKGTQSLIISLCRYIIIMIPAAWILCRLFGPVGVWHAFWVTELLSALAAAFVYKHTVKLNV